MVSARVEEQHRNCCCRTMRAAVRMYRMVAEEAVAELRRIEAQEGAENAPSRAADGWSVRDLADELLTLQPVDPARCNPRRKALGGHRLVASGRTNGEAQGPRSGMGMSESQPIGQLLDSLGVTSTIAPDDLPVAALVLLKVVDAAGDVRLAAAWSDGMDWITRLGMLTAATASETPDPSVWQDQEDDR